MTGGRRRDSEDGFTIVEVLVAALMLAFIIAAGALMFTNGNDTSLQSQRQAALLSVADQQIEAIRQKVKVDGFGALAMSAAPATGTNSTLSYSPSTHTDPDDFVVSASGCGPSALGYKVEQNWDDTNAGSASNTGSYDGCTTGVEPLAVSSASGFVTPKQTVTVGTETAQLYTYVTYTNVGCNANFGGCYGTGGTPVGDARRVVIAIVPTTGNGRYDVGPNSPLYVSTIFTNPTASNAPNSSIGITVGVGIG